MTYEEFIAKSVREWALMPSTERVLDTVLESNLLRDGTWVEFGVAGGETLTRIAAAGKGRADVWGVDSFRGLPEQWRDERYPVGHFAQERFPPVLADARLLVGYFDEVLPAFRPPLPLGLVHIDSDLYSAAVSALAWVDRVGFSRSTIFVFDELHTYQGWEDGEMKALYEWLDGQNVEWLWTDKVEEACALRVIP